MTSSNKFRFVSTYAGKLLGIAFLVAVVMSAGANFNGGRADAAVTVIANSSTGTNRAIHYGLSQYWYMRSQTNWPRRTSCASGIDRPNEYKFMPWLANNNLPSRAGVMGSGSPSYYDGNTITTNGNCRSRYTDGGDYGGGYGAAWLNPNALAGWAMPGGGSGFGNSYVSYSTVSCNNLTGGGASMIWGTSGPDYGDQAYGPGGLLSMRDGRTTYMPGSPNNFGLYSNGTSLIRNVFNISGPQYAEIQSTRKVTFYAVADDWIRVFINGNQVISTTYTKEQVIDINSSYFVPGQNVIAIQVIDKANWTTRDNPSSRQSGVCYNLAVDSSGPVTPPVGSCASRTDFNIDKLVLTGSFTVSGRNNSNRVPFDDNFEVTVWWQGSSGGSPSAVKTLIVPNVNGGRPPTDVESAAISYRDINATRVGYYYITWRYSGGGECRSATSLLSYHPYFSVLGGDISVGPGFGTSCSANTSAIIKGWNLGTAYNYAGAGANLAALALGRITGFATAQRGITGAPGTPGAPSQLAFANTTASGRAPTSTYGGLWGASNSCVPDYVAEASAQTITTGTPDYTTPGTRIYKLNGNQTLGAITVGPGAHVTLVVTGNVYISQSITYGAYGGSVDNIPEFQLLVQGSIYIGGDVGTLHGFYDAQPAGSSSTGGDLHTCATGLNSATSTYNTCNRQLVIYGAVAAKKIYLERSYGTLSDGPLDGAPVDAAEKIIFAPEFWLTGAQPSVTGNALDDWLAVTSLPPVL